MSNSAIIDAGPCGAIPAAARHGWSGNAGRGCASQTTNVILHDGVEHLLCGMHLKSWAAATAERRVDLAAAWGWSS